mgnify:CR=1 FL=1
MNIKTIGVMSPGDMGQAIAGRLKEAEIGRASCRERV